MHTKNLLPLLLTFILVTCSQKANYSANIRQFQQNSLQHQYSTEILTPGTGKFNMLSVILQLSIVLDHPLDENHDHEDGKFHIFHFERIREKKHHFSLRCLVIKCLLTIIHLGIILFIHHHLIT